MNYAEETMGQTPEEKQPDRDGLITWEIILPEQLAGIVGATLNEEVLQDLVATNLTLPTLEGKDAKSLTEAIAILAQINSQTISNVRAIQTALRSLQQDPGQRIPVDHRYEKSGGKPVLALGLLATSNPFK